jgi:hypothetical protein
MTNLYETEAVNALILANATLLVASVVQNIAGNELSSTLNGEGLTKEALIAFASQDLRARLNNTQVK